MVIFQGHVDILKLKIYYKNRSCYGNESQELRLEAILKMGTVLNLLEIWCRVGCRVGTQQPRSRHTVAAKSAHSIHRVGAQQLQSWRTAAQGWRTAAAESAYSSGNVGA